jgi:uncharacterized protein YggT (Ycf19 family)
MSDGKLEADEARREIQHEEVKEQFGTEINAEIESRAKAPVAGEAERIQAVAGEFRGKALGEVAQTEREVERSRTIARVSQVIDFLFYILYALLGLRLLLLLMAARRSAGFVQFIITVTDPFFAPFRGIVASPSVEGGFTLSLPILIALLVYILLHAGIKGVLRIIATRRTKI